jgi:flagellar biosynthesis anti-sigma factor FlgM
MMKIDGQQVTHEPLTTQRSDATKPGRTDGQVRSTEAPGSDRVDVSPAASLVSQALHQASEAPDVREELVERMRQKLAAGEVGADAARLADRLIDHLLDEQLDS